MKACVFLSALCLAAQAASADPAPNRAAPPRSAAVPPKPKVIDLDFSDDGAEEPVPARVPAKSPAAIAPESHQWVYWTMGATALAAAAGGVGWYWHKEQAKTPTVTRSEQVFTDDRP